MHQYCWSYRRGVWTQIIWNKWGFRNSCYRDSHAMVFFSWHTRRMPHIYLRGAKSNASPLISRPDGIQDSLVVFWLDNTQLMKAALSDLNSHSLFDCHSRISDRLFHQEVKMSRAVHKSVALPFFSEFNSINVELSCIYWSIPPTVSYPLEPLWPWIEDR
jgi:hypothetical protein